MDFQKWGMVQRKLSAKTPTVSWKNLLKNATSLLFTMGMGLPVRKPRRQLMITFKLIWKKIKKKLNNYKPTNRESSSYETHSKVLKVS